MKLQWKKFIRTVNSYIYINVYYTIPEADSVKTEMKNGNFT